MDKENTFTINFDGNCFTEIQVTNNEIKVLRSMDRWGNPIDLDRIIIEKVK